MKIGYSATFNMPNTSQPFEKHWVEEDELTHGLNLFEEITDEQLAQLTKNIRRIQYVIRRQVKEFAYESNAAEKKEQAKEKEPESVGSLQDVIDKMNACTILPKPLGLLAYEIMAKTNPVLQAAFDRRFKELSIGQ